MNLINLNRRDNKKSWLNRLSHKNRGIDRQMSIVRLTEAFRRQFRIPISHSIGRYTGNDFLRIEMADETQKTNDSHDSYMNRSFAIGWTRTMIRHQQGWDQVRFSDDEMEQTRHLMGISVTCFEISISKKKSESRSRHLV